MRIVLSRYFFRVYSSTTFIVREVHKYMSQLMFTPHIFAVWINSLSSKLDILKGTYNLLFLWFVADLH